MSRFLGLVLALTLAVGAGAAGQSMEQILAQTGLDPDLVAMLTLEQGGQRLLLFFVYINERTLQSNVRPEIAEIIAPYVGQNAVMIWAYSEEGANFDPGSIWFSQGAVEVGLSPESVVPVSGDFLSGVVPPMTPVVAILVLGEAIDPAQPFAIHYGELAMATLAVQTSFAQAEVQVEASAEAVAQAEASAEAQAQAEVQVQGLVAEEQPCQSCGEAAEVPCGCDPCAWLCGWWSCDCAQAACDPCSGGFIIPLLLLILLGL